MGEYFKSRLEAEDAIRKWGTDSRYAPARMFVHVRDGVTDVWMVDFKRRDIPDSLVLLEDLTGTISTIVAST